MISGECLLVDTVHRKNLRHMFVMYQTSVLLGVLLTWFMGQSLSKLTTTSVCALFCAIHAFLLFFLPESPVYLYEQSGIKAEKSLAWYWGKTSIYTEMRAIRQYSEIRKIDNATNNTMLYSKVVWKALLIVIGIKFFSISSGYYVFLFYNVHAVQEIQIIFDHVYDPLFYGTVMYLSNVISMLIHLKCSFSIRKPLILSSTLVTLVLTIFSLFLCLDAANVKIDNMAARVIPSVCVCFLIIAYETGLSYYAEIALVDYMPHEVYFISRNILRMCHWMFVFVLVKNVIIIRDYAPVSVVCILVLAILSFAGIFYMAFVVVETKGKSLVQVQKDIGGNPIGSRGRLRHQARILATVTQS